MKQMLNFTNVQVHGALRVSSNGIEVKKGKVHMVIRGLHPNFCNSDPECQFPPPSQSFTGLPQQFVAAVPYLYIGSRQSGEQVHLLVNFHIYARRSPRASEEAPIYIVQSERTTSSRRKMKRNVFKF